MEHWCAWKQILKYLKSSMDIGIMFQKAQVRAQFGIVYISSVDDHRSTIGYWVSIGVAW